MAVIYRTITGTIKDSQGNAVAEGSLRVKALAPIVDGDDLIYPDRVEVPVTDGTFTLTLAAPCRYDFLVRDEEENTIWNFEAPLQNDQTIPISLATLFTNQFDTLVDSDAVTANPGQTWVPEGTVGTAVSVDGSEFWYGASRKSRLDYAVQGTTAVARYVDLGASDQMRLWPSGLESTLIVDARGVFELSVLCYAAANGTIIQFGTDIASSTSFFSLGLYSTNLFIESYAQGSPDLIEDYQYESVPHGLTFPNWVYVKASLDFANGTLKAACGNTEPSSWNVEAQMVAVGVQHIRACPFVLLQGNGIALDLASFSWEQVA